ncbi:MAG: electron transfer flavoprotein subunit beta/FixA family protein, partial [Dehalococcoidia bacterium]|nr:electron transfer flavoprotein subunit beta/FixA family protein [Dehalococcoidia bacterium]
MEHIVVCIKQVPDFSRVREVPINPKTGAIMRAGIPSVLNPFDKHAIEEALRLREALGGRVTAITMGPPQAGAVLEDALIMGADRAVLLCDPAFAGADTLATSCALAGAIRKLQPVDLVVCGQETADSGTGHIAPSLAEWLGLPQITLVRKIEIRDRLVQAERAIEGGYQKIEGGLPLVISVARGINQPRPLRLRDIAAAAAKEITVWNLSDLGLEREAVGAPGSPTQVPRVFPPAPRQQAEILTG